MTTPAPVPVSPIHITGDGLALGGRLGPDGQPVGVMTITAAGGLVSVDVALTAETIDAMLKGLRKIRADIPAAGLIPATQADLGRLNGRH